MSKRKVRPSKKTLAKVQDIDLLGIYINRVALWGICFLLFLAPYFRGLFFPQDQQKAFFFALLMFGLVVIWIWLKKDYSFLSHPLDYFVLAFFFIYVISTLNAANLSFAIDKVIEVALCFIIYWCVSRLVRNTKDIEAMLCVIYTSALGLALAGLATATSIIHIKDGFLGGRIYSTLQYPNALASILLAVFIIGFYLWWKRTRFKSEDCNAIINIRLSYLFAIGNYLILAVAFGAKSSGGYIVFILVALALFLILPGWNRIFFFIHLIKVGVLSAAGIFLFLKNAESQLYSQAWLWLLGGIVMVVALQWLYLRLMSITDDWQRLFKWLAKAMVACTAVLTIIILYLYFGNINDIMESAKKVSLFHRFYFVEDAFGMIKERLLLGWGGGGWKDAYRSFQSYSYTSSQVHSYYIQVAVETGLAGLAALTGIWAVFVQTGLRAYRKNRSINDRMLVITIVGLAMTLGVHASVDFNLSLVAITMIMYAAMAIIRNMDAGFLEIGMTKSEKTLGIVKVPIILAASGGIIMLLLVTSFITASGYAKNAIIYANNRNIKQAILLMEKALVYNPLMADYHGTLSELYSHNGQKDKAMEEASKAVALNRYNEWRYLYLSSLTLSSGDVKAAIKYSEDAIAKSPWGIGAYEYASLIYRTSGLVEQKKGQLNEARMYFAETTEMVRRINERLEKLDPDKKRLSDGFYITPRIGLNVGISYLFLNDLNNAREFLAFAATDVKMKGEAMVWLSIIFDKQNDPVNATNALNQAKELLPGYEEIYNEYKSLVR